MDTLSVNLIGFVPKDYIVEATTPDGKTVSVHCIDGVGQYADGIHHLGDPTCEKWGIVFYGFAPREVTITVSWGTNKATQTFKPTYEVEQPNGPDCEPECRFGGIAFMMPDD